MNPKRVFRTAQHFQNLALAISSGNSVIPKMGLIDIYRGLRDVESVCLDQPGQYWTLSIEVASRYAIPSEPIFIRDSGVFFFGHLLTARISASFGNIPDLLDQINSRSKSPVDIRDLFEVFVPPSECAALHNFSILYSSCVSVAFPSF